MTIFNPKTLPRAELPAPDIAEAISNVMTMTSSLTRTAPLNYLHRCEQTDPATACDTLSATLLAMKRLTWAKFHLLLLHFLLLEVAATLVVPLQSAMTRLQPTRFPFISWSKVVESFQRCQITQFAHPLRTLVQAVELHCHRLSSRLMVVMAMAPQPMQHLR